MSGALAFTLTPAHEAGTPPEARGLERDEVRLLVAQRDRLALVHDSFRNLPAQLRAGDLLVVNTSATIPAALPATRADGTAVDLHLSTPVPGAVATARGRVLTAPGYGVETARAPRWVVELRRAGARFRWPVRASGSRCRRADRLSWSRPTSRPGGCGSPRSIFPRRWTATWPSTGARSPTATSPARARCATSRPCSPTNRAAPRCRPPPDPSRRACWPSCSGRGVQVAPIVLHTGVASSSPASALSQPYHVPAITAAGGQRRGAARADA